MLRSIITTTLLLLFFSSSAQITIRGHVTDTGTGNPLPGATILIEGTYTGTVSDREGNFILKNIKPGIQKIRTRFVGFNESISDLDIKGDTVLNILLSPATYISDEVIITATRAGEKTPMAVSEISNDDIRKSNTSRDLPYLLESVPSLVTTSDAGTGIGYTGLRIRGSDASRINVTVNGIPINDSESQLVFWVNMPDIGSSAENIQVQRGVGTSTNGAGAFGGSINIFSSKPSPKPYATVSSAYGSFNTWQHQVLTGTGLINNRWNFEGRLSKITSDGYVDRAFSDLKSYYLSGGYYGDKSFLKAIVFSGKEKTYQSWSGVPEASLDTNRTWNYYTYDNQVDDYQQDHYQLHYSTGITSEFDLNAAIHFTHGEGFYEEFEDDDLLSNYGIDNVTIGQDTISFSDIIRRKWLDNNFYGTTFSLNYHPAKNASILLGGGWNQYDGDHFGEVIWAQHAGNSHIRHRYYFNNGLKTDFNIFLKANLTLGEYLGFFGDLQYRKLNYSFTGLDDNSNPLPQSASENFWNPKAGVTYTIDEGKYGYASFAVANKEPSRDDYTESSQASRPGPERLYDFEAGYRHRTGKLFAAINFYAMIYDDQLVLTGEINDVGNYTRTNVSESSRKGVELEAGYMFNQYLRMKANATFSENKIEEFREYVDDYDTGGQLLLIHNNTDIAFSPKTIGFIEILSNPSRNIELSVSGKFVGKQFLDNTSNNNRVLDSYYTTNIKAAYKFKLPHIRELEIAFFVNNVWDSLYESNGYTFSYISGNELTTENYFYPQAGRNFLGRVRFNF